MHRPRRERPPSLFDKHNPEPCDIAARRGMERATAHATDVHPDWTERAMAFLVTYATHHATFWGHELVRAARESSDVPYDPSGGKAWGSVISLACRRGVIGKTGKTGPDPNRHGDLIWQWGSLIYNQATEARI